MQTIYDLVKEAENNYTRGNVKRGKYLSNWDMYDTIERINAYANSQHISGKYDSLGREKPFFNIVTAAVNIWYRATDIDRRNIKFKANNSSTYIKAFIATIMLRQWMKKENFGQFLNKWGRTLAKYGSAVVKFAGKDGELIPSVISWDKLICDPVEFDGNIKIEKLYFTPSQLRQNKFYDQQEVEKAISSIAESRKTIDNQKKDNRSDYIGVYEVHGSLPLSFITGKDKDKDEYRQQMHVIFSNGTGEDKVDASLYSGKEAKDPYMLTHLIEEEGRTLSIGAIEHLFDAQWMVNNSVKQIKDQLDLASKMVLQTSDELFAGRNVLTNIETGDILIHSMNAPITQVNNQSHDTPAITNFLEQWKNQGREITGTPEAIMGETMPSGTAYRQVAALQQEAHSLFEIMTENKGLYLEQMMIEYIIPYFKKSLNTADEVALVLEPEEIEKLDNLSLPSKLEEEIKSRILGDNAPLPSVEELTATVESRQKQTGATRFIKPSSKNITWNKYFNDLENDVDVVITNENINKEATMTTLTTVLQTVAQNPNILSDPTMKRIFGKILETAGEISPIELSAPASNAQGMNQPPAGQGQAPPPGSIAGQSQTQ